MVGWSGTPPGSMGSVAISELRDLLGGARKGELGSRLQELPADDFMECRTWRIQGAGEGASASPKMDTASP